MSKRIVNRWPPDSTAVAQAMLDAINNHPIFPIIGENGGITEDWQTELTTWSDDWVGFDEVPPSELIKRGVSEAEAQGLRDAFQPTKVAVSELKQQGIVETQ